MARFGKRALARRAITLSAITCAVLAACSRSGLAGFDAVPIGGSNTEADGAPGATTPGASGAPSITADAHAPAPDAAPDAPLPVPTSTSSSPPTPTSIPPTPTSTSPNPTMPPNCVPHDETCNGVDDDCNGEVDDGIAPIPCPSGGERYCVAGRMSACPTRCETCVPGSERVCFLSYCTYWAAQVCAADGRSFGVCRERSVPAECHAVADAHKDSPELEQCCIDKGYCCRDEYDLDHDGNRSEMLGQCDEVSCSN